MANRMHTSGRTSIDIFASIPLLLSKTVFLLILSAWGVGLRAQTIVSTLWPERGMLPASQLWRISLLNAQAVPFGAYVEMTVSDAANGQPLYKAASSPLSLTNGVNVLTLQTVQPVAYTVLSPVYRFNPSSGGLLPPGLFNVCYRVIRSSGEVYGVLGEGCFRFESDALTPPSLVMPSENDSIRIQRPFFTWLPPVPSSALSALNYAIRVVEKGNRQSPQEAIERNSPVFTQQRLAQTSTNFPIGLPQLVIGKQYAWQVIAYNGTSYVAASACWAFKISSDTVTTRPLPASAFVPLIRDGSAQLVSTKQDLRFSYNNEVGDTSLSCLINKLEGVGRKPGSSTTYELKVAAGNNYVTIDLEKIDGLKRGIVYELQILNARNERWWANFIWMR